MTPRAELQREVEFFDRFQERHGDYDVLGDRAYRTLLRELRQRTGARSGEACVDLGCGTGAFSRRLAAAGLRVTGIDISPASIREAAARATNERFVVGDIKETRLPAESLDIAVFSAVLHHLPGRDERLGALREAYRILRPGGRVFAFDPHAHSPSMFLYRDPRSPLYSSVGKTENEVLLSRTQMRDELKQAGFQDADAVGAGGITFRYVESGIARLMLPLYNLYELASLWPPYARRFGTFLVCFGTKPVSAG